MTDIKWRPKIREKYYYLVEGTREVKKEINTNLPIDKHRFETDNCFKTHTGATESYYKSLKLKLEGIENKELKANG